MKSKSGSLAVKILAAGAVFVSMLSVINAQTLRQAPENPEFAKYLQSRAQKTTAPGTVSGYGRGLIPEPVDLSYLKGRVPAGMRTLQALPATYDLRTLGKLTSVKDQGDHYNCWTYTTYGSMESALLPGETNNFSENNLANLHGFNLDYDSGGNYFMSTAYLTRWSGPINEIDDPASNGPGHSPSNLPPQKHVQEVLILPPKASALDNTAIKQAVMNYGPVAVSMYFNYATNFYNFDNYAYYYNGIWMTAVNHAVAIIGWDDDYAASNFKQTPAGNGAFIVRNSYSAEFGDRGYFYCSYYDALMGSEASMVFNNAEAVTNYASVYQYDPLGRVTDWGYDSTNAWFANIFTATNSETLRAVGFYTTDIDVNYKIYIYCNIIAGSPCNGTLKLSQTGSISYSGYHTIALPSLATVSSGQLFSVVIQLVTPLDTFPLAIEHARAGYSTKATSSPGQSYISFDGISWTDLTTVSFATANNCIKAYCGAASAQVEAVPAVADYDGDSKSDPTLYYEAMGIWKIKKSASDYALTSTNYSGLGGNGLASVSADYDGDRLADPAVYQELTGTWIILLSSAGYARLEVPHLLGGPGYSAIPADYDGDRLADPAVYQVSSGNWKIMLSSAGYSVIEIPAFLGGAGYLAVPADYDGDRLADPAVYAGSTGLWTILLSSASYYSITISVASGGNGYLPCPGDYDGDRLADPTVKIISGNEWIIMLSSAGYTPIPVTLQFE